MATSVYGPVGPPVALQPMKAIPAEIVTPCCGTMQFGIETVHWVWPFWASTASSAPEYWPGIRPAMKATPSTSAGGSVEFDVRLGMVFQAGCSPVTVVGVRAVSDGLSKVRPGPPSLEAYWSGTT